MTEREVVQRILAVTVAVSFTIQGVAQEPSLNEGVSDRLENPLMSGSWDTSPYRVQLFPVSYTHLTLPTSDLV